jgi:restriction system protein
MGFPSDIVRDEYLKNVKNYSDKDVKDTLRKFIIKTGRIEADNWNLKFLVSLPKNEFDTLLENSEYYKRNLRMEDNAWEGLTWVLELLPRHPKMAIEALNAYFVANCAYMTDQQMFTVEDCLSIIRAKYYETEHPKEFLLQINPLEFERLVSTLYKKLGYKTDLTKNSYDNGIDILIEKEKVGKKEKSVVQCKRSKNNIGVPIIRELAGTISNLKATKGILITTSNFTRQAILFSEMNPRIELINFQKLTFLLNMHLGSDWPNRLDHLVREKTSS